MEKDLSYSNPVKNTANAAMRLLRDICSPITTGIGKIKMNQSKMTLRGPWTRPRVIEVQHLRPISDKVQLFPALVCQNGNIDPVKAESDG